MEINAIQHPILKAVGVVPTRIAIFRLGVNAVRLRFAAHQSFYTSAFTMEG